MKTSNVIEEGFHEESIVLFVEDVTDAKGDIMGYIYQELEEPKAHYFKPNDDISFSKICMAAITNRLKELDGDQK